MDRNDSSDNARRGFTSFIDPLLGEDGTLSLSLFDILSRLILDWDTALDFTTELKVRETCSNVPNGFRLM